MNYGNDQILREQYAEYLKNTIIQEKKLSQGSLGTINVGGGHTLIGNSFGSGLNLSYNRKKAKAVVNTEWQKNIQPKFEQFPSKITTNLSEIRRTTNTSFNPAINISGSISTLGGNTIVGGNFGDYADFSYKNITYLGGKDLKEERIHKINLEGVDIAPPHSYFVRGTQRRK